MAKIIAAVEKFAGNINPSTKKTGNHKGTKVCLKLTRELSIVERYLAT
ncbi:MAG: Uncharacterised protein [Flavobacteriaceae bacterium]|nr:MAG: Uncharacterised protein [Flavobacteriaceae bacterium]